ncbi:MAG: GDP-mannose 4,6-dehydratase [Planctomycetes bacterium]|nr:GDP-mannose 4,6-dehydratase [Planctomycetota bacterium]
MKVLVTGVAGFIGSHVAQKCLESGYEVIGVDNLNDYYEPRLKEYRLAQIEGQASFRFEKIDLAERKETEELFAREKPELVIHLAAQAGVRYSIENPHSYTRNNIEAFLNILEACRHNKVRRLCYASSSSVYGGLKTIPFSEEMSVDTPISLYAATKKANELMAHTYTHLYGFETVGLRFFTVYGPKGRPDMAMWLFTDAILNGRAIKVFNHGDMRRDFTYIDDIVSGVMGSAESKLPSPCEVYNLGNHNTEELGHMIALIEKKLDMEAIKDYLPMQAGDVPETYANIDKAQKDLGFSPQTPLEEGINRFIDWYKDEWLNTTEK